MLNLATITTQAFDVIVIGAGGAGLRAALKLSEYNKKIAVISKVFPTRSHTVSAQGGITVALGNVEDDNWQWHMFDTIKGSDYLGDQDAIRHLCLEGKDAVIELERMGLPFSRLPNGKIYQRAFGGQSKDFGRGGQAIRTAAASDRTGHALLHTLYQQNIKVNTIFFNEYYAIDLIKNIDGTIGGVLALSIAQGELILFTTQVVILATGGAGQIFASTTNALINTGDGLNLAAKIGVPLQDMEMWQFHPTGIYNAGVLISEGCRGEGGYLVNNIGERFMQHYASKALDLASRDVVARAISMEIAAGRGCGAKGDHVLLKLEHLGESVIKNKLPGIRELALAFANVDPLYNPIPVVPTCHYMMGGVPTNIKTEVVSVDANCETVLIPNLYAVGECACVSVHGANRLGGNSLLDLIVFGKTCGIEIGKKLNSSYVSNSKIDSYHLDFIIARLNSLEKRQMGEPVHQLRRELKDTMQEHFGVFRSGKLMHDGLNKINIIKQKMQYLYFADKSLIFNTARLQAYELENLLAVAYATAVSALTRTESRGAHAREDYKTRNDREWLKHILVYANGEIRYRAVDLQPNNMPSFLPTERVY